MKDLVDSFIKSVNWKFGNFSLLPIFLGTVMAVLDIFMMSSVKMIKQGTLSVGFGLPFSTLVYALQPYIFLKALNYENMTVVNLVWNLMSDIVVTLQGIIFFGESIAGLRWLAICMSLVSLVLFSYTDSS